MSQFLLKRVIPCIFISFFFFTMQGHAAGQNKTYPKEALSDRVERISKEYGVNIVYNPDAGKIELPELTVIQQDVQWVLKESMASTGLNIEQTGSSIILKKNSQEPQQEKSPSGSLRGRIVEAESSEPLPGATVKIAGTKLVTMTDLDGYYNFPKAPAGRQTIEVSFIGYAAERAEVRLTANRINTQDIKLNPDATQLNEVVVSSVRRSRSSVPHTTERLVVQEIKGLSVVVSGISSEQISRSADRNAGEVVKKIAGVSVKDDKLIIVRGMNERYNLTYLNNNIAPSTELYSRAFALDLLPSRIIDKIMIYKSSSPDLMADMTGGAVKIFTKDAMAVRHFDVELQAAGRESTVFRNDFLVSEGSSTDWLGFDDGLRKLPSVVNAYSNSNKTNISQAAYVDNFSDNLQYGRITAMPDIQFTANYYDAFIVGGRPLSLLTSLSYKKDYRQRDYDRLQSILYKESSTEGVFGAKTGSKSYEEHSTQSAQINLLQNFTYSLNEKSQLYFKNYILQQGSDQTTIKTGQQTLLYSPGSEEWYRYMTEGQVENTKNISYTYSQRFLYSGNIGMNWKDKKEIHVLDLNGGYTFSRLEMPDQRVIRLTNIGYGSERQGGGAYPDLNYIALPREEFKENNTNRSLQLGKISRAWTQNSEYVVTGSLDYQLKPAKWFYVKAGAFHLWKQRRVYRKVFTLNEGDLDDTGYASIDNIGRNGQFMDPNLVFFREQDLGSVWSHAYINDAGTGLKVYDRTGGSDSYKASEQNTSAYLMGNLSMLRNKVEVTGGMRFEYDHQQVASAIDQSRTTVNFPVMADIERYDWFPSINLNLRPTDSWVFRASYGETLNRPEFREISSFSEFDYTENQTIEGNPSLVPSYTKNYDMRLEFYPAANQKGEMISVGVFYKEITDPIERTIYEQTAWPLSSIAKTFPIVSFQNGNRAEIKGLEVEFRKQLDFIPLPVIRDLTVIANYSYIHSQVDSVRNDRWTGTTNYINRRLQGQAPYILNLGLYYENARSGSKASLTYYKVGESIYAAAMGNYILATAISGAGNTGSILELERSQLDFSFSQRISKGWQLKFNIQNLLDNPIQRAEDADFDYKYTPLKRVTAEKEGESGGISGDFITSEYRSGRFYVLSLSYSF